jgi:hypothetical protein
VAEDRAAGRQLLHVAKAYVEKHGDGSEGRVTNTLNVRVGSTLNAMKTKLAMKLDAGTNVQILGEQDEYFKIKPPEGVFVYVNKQFVDAVKVLASDTQAQTPATQPELAQSATGRETPAAPAARAGRRHPPSRRRLPRSPRTRPWPRTSRRTIRREWRLRRPHDRAGQPAVGRQCRGRVRSARDRLRRHAQQPLDQQDIPSMISSYQKMSASNQLPESLRRVAEAKSRFPGQP